MKIKKSLPTIFGILIVFLFFFKIDSFYHTESSSSSDSFIMRLLGETRSIFSNMSILQADIYYHGGASMYSKDYEEPAFLKEDDSSCKDHSHDHHHTCGHTCDHENEQVLTKNILLNLGNITQISEHIHLQSDKVHEIIPWLQYAVILDPNNVQAYLLTAYFLANRFDMVDEAIELLNKGLEHNPESRQLYQDLGSIHLFILKQYDKAEEYLEKAWELMQKEREVEPYEVRRLLASIANVYEAQGDIEKALQVYNQMDELYPDSPITEAHIERLSEKIKSQ